MGHDAFQGLPAIPRPVGALRQRRLDMRVVRQDKLRAPMPDAEFGLQGRVMHAGRDDQHVTFAAGPGIGVGEREFGEGDAVAEFSAVTGPQRVDAARERRRLSGETLGARPLRLEARIVGDLDMRQFARKQPVMQRQAVAGRHAAQEEIPKLGLELGAARHVRRDDDLPCLGRRRLRPEGGGDGEARHSIPQMMSESGHFMRSPSLVSWNLR